MNPAWPQRRARVWPHGQGAQAVPASLSAPRVSAEAGLLATRGGQRCLSLKSCLPGARQRRFAWAARCSLGPDADHGRPRRAGDDRPALHRHRHPCGGAEARLRHAYLVRRPAADRAGPRPVLARGRSDDLGVPAAPGRQVPRRLRHDGGGRRRLDPAHADAVGPEPDQHLCPPRRGHQGRRPAHVAGRHRWAGADPAERLHPPLRHFGPRDGRADAGELQRGLQQRPRRDRHRPLPLRLLDAARAVHGRAQRRLVGPASPGSATSAARSAIPPPASRSSARDRWT